MKKVIFAGLGIFAALFLVFTACEQATTDSGSEPEPAVDANSFSVRIAEGGVLLTWKPEVNALQYEVWRQQTSPDLEKAKLLKTLNRSDELFYADVKSLTNQLKPNVDYQYTIIATSNSSTSQPGAPYEIVQNTALTKEVKFTAAELPATITLTPVTGLQLRVLGPELNTNNVVAAWDADDNPLVQYEVIVNANNSYTTTTFANAILLTGSDNTYVSVRKVLGDSSYYAPSAAASKYVALAKTDEFVLRADRDDKGVTIIFGVADDKPSLPLSDYTLSRMKLAPVAGNWENVALTSARSVSNNPFNQPAQYELYDTLPNDAENNSIWLYELAVKHGAYVKYTITNTIDVGTLANPSLTYLKYEISVSPDTTADGLAPIIYATYNIEPDADYALFIQQASGPNGVNDGIVYDWNPITVATADKTTGASSERVKITLPQARTKYNLKVVATGKGAKAAYKSAESTQNGIQFRAPITVGYEPAALIYEVNSLGSTHTRLIDSTDSGGDIEYTVYALQVQGLTSSDGTTPRLRTGEALKIELVLKGSATAASTYKEQTLNYSSVTYNDNGVSETEPTQGYYFKVPALPSIGDDDYDPNAAYEIRLHVTAK